MLIRIKSVFLAGIMLMVVAGVFQASAQTPAENKAIVVRAWEEVFNQGNLDAAGELFAADYVFHGIPEGRGPEYIKQSVLMLRTAFPDWHTTVDDTIAVGDKVVSRVTHTGTQQGEFMGIPPTGNQVTITAILVSRIAGGKIAEDGSTPDMLGVMQQLGVAPPMGRADFTWGAPSAITGDPGDPAVNQALAIRFAEEVWNQQNLTVLDEIADSNLVVHHPLTPSFNLDMAKQSIAMYLTAFPDFHVTVNDTLAESDKVAGRWTATGTHQGALMDIPPTGKPVMLTGTTIYRFAGGKMVEQWWSLDALGMFQQLGIIPAPGGNPWSKQTDMPTARGALSTSAVDGIIYAIGGGAGPFSN